MSGLDSCSAAQVYGGPDTPDMSLSGTCRDLAGNTAPASVTLRYDETSPQASAAARPPDANGWFNHAVTITFQGADATSGVDSCTQVTYAGPDDSSVALSGTCRDRAGNESASSPFTLRYDETPPQASATPSRGGDVDGWYNHALTVSFSGSDSMSGLDSCDAPRSYTGPDSASASVTGSCRDRAGNAAPRSFGLRYDSTAPQVTAAPGRPPNANGWYNAPISVGFNGSDAIAGNRILLHVPELLGPGQRLGAGRRDLHGPSGQRRLGIVPVEVRRDRAPGDGHPGSPGRPDRLVQRAARGQLRRNGRDGRHRHMRSGRDLFRSRQRSRNRQRLVPRPCR